MNLIIFLVACCSFTYKVGTKLAEHGGWAFFKVPTTSTIDTAVKSACETAGYVTPCMGSSSSCSWSPSGSACTYTSENGCVNPMKTSAVAAGCTSAKTNCPSFQNVYAYMAGRYNNGKSCGVSGTTYCATGSSSTSGFAFCARSVR